MTTAFCIPLDPHCNNSFKGSTRSDHCIAMCFGCCSERLRTKSMEIWESSWHFETKPFWIYVWDNLDQKHFKHQSYTSKSIWLLFRQSSVWIPAGSRNFFCGSISQSRNITIPPNGSSYLLNKFCLRQTMAKSITFSIIHCKLLWQNVF